MKRFFLHQKRFDSFRLPFFGRRVYEQKWQTGPGFAQQLFFPLDILFFQSILHCHCLKNCQEDTTMRNLTTAVFLIFIFCAVFASGKVLAKGSNRNSFFVSPTSYQRTSGNTRQVNYNRSFRDTLWEKRLKEWEKSHSAVPQRLPRASNFKIHHHSSSRRYRSSHRSFRSSHRHTTRHVRRGRSHSRGRRR